MTEKQVVSITRRGSDLRVLMLDEHPVFRSGLTGFLSREPGLEIVAETSSTDDVWRILESDSVDVILVDFCLGTSRGEGFIRSIRSQYPHVRVMVMSMFDEPEELAPAIAAGAHGAVPKTQSPRAWMEMLRQVVDEGRPSDVAN